MTDAPKRIGLCGRGMRHDRCAGERRTGKHLAARTECEGACVSPRRHRRRNSFRDARIEDIGD